MPNCQANMLLKTPVQPLINQRVLNIFKVVERQNMCAYLQANAQQFLTSTIWLDRSDKAGTVCLHVFWSERAKAYRKF